MEVRRFPWACLSITLMAAGSCLADLQVNTCTNRDRYAPFVAMNDRGDAVVMWRSFGPGEPPTETVPAE